MKHFEEVFEEVKNGASWKIDFLTRTFIVNGEKLIDNGEHVGVEYFDFNVDMANMVFDAYQHSIPSKNAPSRPYFVAPPFDKLSDFDKLVGGNRELCRFRLEFVVLECIINGSITIPDGQWFWQSPIRKDFIILRSWIEQSEK